MVDICLLGCGGGMPMPFRSLSATMISYKGRKILIDCGEGTQVSIKIARLGFKAIDAILITHCHGDHIVGLPGLLSTIGNSGRTEPLTIIGPSGIERVVNGLRVIAEYLPYEVNIIENPKEVKFDIDKEVLKVTEDDAQVVLSTLELDHSSPCLGYSFYFKRDKKFSVEKATQNNVPKILWSKLQKNKDVEYEGKTYYSNMVLGDDRRGIKISLTTDTRPTEDIPQFIKESDLFICEGTYGNEEDREKAIKNKHLTFKEAGALAKMGDVRELLLTHFSPAMLDPNDYRENVIEIFKNTIIGEDRLEKTISFPEN